MFFDRKGVDGTVGGMAALVGGSSGRLRRVQNGFVRSYALTMLAGRRRHPRCRLGGAVMSSFPWLTTIGLIPLVGALVVALLPASVADKAKHLALGFSVVTLLFTIAAALQFKTSSNAQFQLVEQHAWIPQFGVSYALGVDGIALVLIAMSAVLVPVCLLAAWHDVPEVGRAAAELLRPDAGARDVHDRHLRRDRRLPVLRPVRGDARSRSTSSSGPTAARAGSTPR